MSEGVAPATAPSAAPGDGEVVSEAGEPTSKEEAVNPFKGTKHKVKLDNQEAEVDYDDLVSDYQRKEVSNKRFQEAAKIESRIREFYGALKTGDKRALDDIAQTVPKEILKGWAEEFLIADMEEAELTDEERTQRQRDQELEDLKAEKENWSQKERQAEWNEEVRSAGEAIEQELEEFFESTGSERNPWVIARAMEFLIAEEEEAEKRGERPNIKKAHTRAVKTLEMDGARYLHGKSPEDFIKLAPAPFVRALKDFFIGSETRGVKRYEDNDPDPTPSAPRKEKVKLGIDDWFANKEKQVRKR